MKSGELVAADGEEEFTTVAMKLDTYSSVRSLRAVAQSYTGELPQRAFVRKLMSWRNQLNVEDADSCYSTSLQRS